MNFSLFQQCYRSSASHDLSPEMTRADALMGTHSSTDTNNKQSGYESDSEPSQ
jgi:hypothetical protein